MRMITLLILLISLCAVTAIAGMSVISMKAHDEAGLSCADCHGTAEPAKKPNKSYCIACHDDGSGSYYGAVIPNVPGAGKREVNPHNSHQGDLRCTLCHSYHKEPRLMCNDCHNYELEVK